jgi:metal-responsive CopG/Arc/MetJ family transcriptional regulator
MPEQAAPQAGDYRAYVTFTLPVSVLQRLQPFTNRRARSEFIRQAIQAALDKAEQNRDRAVV